MKGFGLWLGLLLCIGSQAFAQTEKDSEEAVYYYKFPESALQTADSLYREAVKRQDGALKIKALVMKAKFALVKDRESYPQVLQELEKQIAAEKDVRVRSVLHSYAGELYVQNYRNRRGIINERPVVEGNAPKDMRTWDKNKWLNQIDKHLRASLEESKVLQATDIKDFKAALLPGEDSERQEPTLYDFLCRRATDILSERGMAGDGKVTESVFLPAEEFVRAGAGVFAPEEKKEERLSIPEVFQRRLAFRLGAGEREALLAADLERLRFMYTNYYETYRHPLYTKALDRLMQEFEKEPFVTEVIYERATLSALDNDEEKLKEALALCEKGIRQFPGYKRIGILKEVVNKIQMQEIHVNFPTRVYPGETFSCQVGSRNSSSCTLQFYRLADEVLRTSSPWGREEEPKKKLVREMRLDLPGGMMQRDTSFEVEGLPAGMYAVTVDKGKETCLLLASQLFCTASIFDGEVRFQVYDWNSGLPVKDSKVSVYRRKEGEYVPIATLHADRKGLAWYKSHEGEKYLYYRVANEKNPASYVDYSYVIRHFSTDRQEEYGQLFTDRKIYRPGQTVYFKGYRWTANCDTLQASEGKETTVVLRNSKREEVAHLRTRSNEFGTFTGSFVVPKHAMNGTFTIDCPNIGEVSFRVENYKRPSFEVTFIPQSRTYYRGDSVRVKGRLKQFTGVAMGNIPLHYRVEQSSFYRHTPSAKFTEGEIHTDEQGEFELAFATTKESQAWGYDLYRITATATDPKGETQEGETAVQVYSGQANIVVDAPLQVDKNRPTAFHIALNDLPEGTVQTVEYTLEKVVAPALSDKPWKDTVVEKKIFDGTLSVNGKDSVMPDLHREASGAYLFTARCGERVAKKLFFLYGQKDKTPPVPTYDWLVVEQLNYKPGEKACIWFGSSLKDVHLQYEFIANSRPVMRKEVRLSNEIIPIEFTYLKEYGESVTVSITYLKDKKWVERSVVLQLDERQPQPELETVVFRDRLRPGEEEEWKVRIKNLRAGEKAEVLAMMYDASLERLSDYFIHFKPGKLSRPNYFSLETFSRTWETNSLHLYMGNLPYGNQSYPAFRFNRLNDFEMGQGYDDFVLMDAETVVTGMTSRSSKRGVAASGLARNAKLMTEEHSPAPLRENFQETAFFYPQLQTDAEGSVEFSFTVPDALTRWRFVAIASTKDMKTGMLERTAVTTKPLMVRPNLPRFLRRGDRANIKVEVENLSDALQEGTVTFELFTPSDDKVLFRGNRDFRMEAGTHALVDFTFDVAATVETVACRVVAKSAGFSDGEQHYLPLLSNEILVQTNLPIFMHSAGKQAFSLPQTSGSPYRLTLELAANPIWYAVQAIPRLQQPAHANATDVAAAYYANSIAARIAQANPKIIHAIRQWQASEASSLVSPLESNEELKSVLAELSPWSMEARTETERMQQLAELFDSNRLRYLQEDAIARLAELQTESGGWCWFKGMGESRFMTMNVLTILQRVALAGSPTGEKEKMMQMKAIRYLDQAYTKHFKEKPKRIDYMQVLYLHTRSLFRDIPLGEALKAHKYFMQLAQKQWAGASLYEKALLAMTFHRYGFEKEAQTILKSLRQYAVSHPNEGMYWPNNRVVCRYSALQIHTALLEAFETVEGYSKDIDLMKQWLLRQKQVQDWGSVPATVDAIHALLLSGDDLTARHEQAEVTIGSETLRTEDGEAPLGYLRVSYDNPSHDMLKVEIQKHADSPTWGGLFLQSFQALDKISKHKTEISVDKKLYVERPDGQLEAVVGKRPLKVGDKVIVRLVLSLERDMDYLHVKDLRAACFEPAKQLSGNRRMAGVSFYQEVKDASMNFFFEFLPHGTHMIDYPLWVNQEGSYQDGIASFQSIYAPAYNAYSQAGRVEVER